MNREQTREVQRHSQVLFDTQKEPEYLGYLQNKAQKPMRGSTTSQIDRSRRKKMKGKLFIFPILAALVFVQFLFLSANNFDAVGWLAPFMTFGVLACFMVFAIANRSTVRWWLPILASFGFALIGGGFLGAVAYNWRVSDPGFWRTAIGLTGVFLPASTLSVMIVCFWFAKSLNIENWLFKDSDICKYCQKRIPNDDAEYCPWCGTRQREE